MALMRLSCADCPQEVSEALWDVQGVVNVQCLHVWALTSGKYLVSVNVQVGGPVLVNSVNRERCGSSNESVGDGVRDGH